MAYVTDLKSDQLEDTRVNPQKRNLLIRQMARAPWWLLILISFLLVFYIEVSERRLYKAAWEDIQTGINITVRVTIAAYGLALLMGLIIALLRRPSNSVIYNLLIYQPVTTYVELIRGIPTLVLLLYIVLALIPQAVRWGNGVGDWMLDHHLGALGVAQYLSDLIVRDVKLENRAIFALAVSYSAFLSEIFRAGLESVPKGQRDAARSLGMSDWQMNRHIILPQAVLNVLPPLGNDFIAMLKESSLVSIVGVADITRLARDFNSATFTVFPAYNIIALTYLAVTLMLSMFVKGLEQYMGRGRESG